jgi:hypothetical protein
MTKMIRLPLWLRTAGGLGLAGLGLVMHLHPQFATIRLAMAGASSVSHIARDLSAQASTSTSDQTPAAKTW